MMEDVNVNAVRAQSPPDQSGPRDSGRESTEGTKAKPCRQFQKTGECRYGDKCIFSHNVQKPPQVRPGEEKPPKPAPKGKTVYASSMPKEGV